MSDDRPTIELLTVAPEDTYNFCMGQPVVLDQHGRRMTGLRLLLWRARNRVYRLTRWWRPRVVVSAIDQEAGIVTISSEHWSWRRWRWERVA